MLDYVRDINFLIIIIMSVERKRPKDFADTLEGFLC